MDEQNVENTPKDSESKTLGIHDSLVFLGIGAVLILINVIMICTAESYFPKILAVGMVSFCVGIGTIVFPAPDIVTSENKKEAAKERFDEASPLTKVIWILYALAGIGGAIVVVVGKTWTSSIIFLSCLLIVSGLIMFIRLLVNIFKPTSDDDYTDDDKKYSYYNPSKKGCLLGMLLGLAILSIGCYGIYWTGAFKYTFYTISSKIESTKNIKKYGHLISENMDKEVPVCFVQDYDIVPIIKLTSLDGDFELEQEAPYIEAVTISLGELVKEVLSDNSKFEAILLGDSENIISFDKEELRKIQNVKDQAFQITRNNALRFSTNDKYSTFVEDNWDEPVIISIPSLYYEYVKVWDLESFVKLYSQLYPENPISSEEDIIGLLDEDGCIPGTKFIITYLDSMDICLWDEETREIGYIINYLDNESAGYLEIYLPPNEYDDSESEYESEYNSEEA